MEFEVESTEIKRQLNEIGATKVLLSYRDAPVYDVMYYNIRREEGRIEGRYVPNGDSKFDWIMFRNMGNLPLSYLLLSDGRIAFLLKMCVGTESFEVLHCFSLYSVVSYGESVVNGASWQLYFGLNPLGYEWAEKQKDNIRNISGAKAYILQAVYCKDSNGDYFSGYISLDKFKLVSDNQ